ncbi:hypothetical protein D3C86_2250100 [compost metagenome]
MTFPLMWRGRSLQLAITRQALTVTLAGEGELTLFVQGKANRIAGTQTIALQ